MLFLYFNVKITKSKWLSSRILTTLISVPSFGYYCAVSNTYLPKVKSDWVIKVQGQIRSSFLKVILRWCLLFKPGATMPAATFSHFIHWYLGRTAYLNSLEMFLSAICYIKHFSYHMLTFTLFVNGHIFHWYPLKWSYVIHFSTNVH